MLLAPVVWLMDTHSAKEVSDEYHHRSVFCVIELFELDGFATFIEDFELAGFLERLLVWLGAAFARLCHGRGSGSDVSSVVMVSIVEMLVLFFSWEMLMYDRCVLYR